jgi:hypothetical protein
MHDDAHAGLPDWRDIPSLCQRATRSWPLLLENCPSHRHHASSVQELVARGRTLLLSAYTNAALDNVLLKLVDSGFTDLLRLGRADAADARLLPYTLEAAPGCGTSALAIRRRVRPRAAAPLCTIKCAQRRAGPA